MLQLDVRDWKCVSSENRTDLSVCGVFLDLCVCVIVLLFYRNGVSGSLAHIHYTVVFVSAGLNQQELFDQRDPGARY